MIIAPISCGMYSRKRSNVFCRDCSMSIGYLSLVVLSTSGSLRPSATSPGAPEAPYCSPDKGEEQGEDARDGQDRAEPLLRSGLLGAALRALGQGDARELVYEAHSQKSAHYRQHDRDDEGQEGHQKPVLQALAAREAAGDVAADQEGQQQRDHEPNEGGGATFCEALSPGGAEDGAYYAT